MIERFTRTDVGILISAAVLAMGAFCPIVRMPVVGSINYVMGGRGDGVFVVGCSVAIVACVVFGYRRTSGVLASCTMVITILALVKFSAALSQAQASLVKNTGGAGGLGTLLAQSVGLEWGWLLLIGGASAVIILAFLAPLDAVALPDGLHSFGSDDSDSFSSADRIIADYLENRKNSPAIRNESTGQKTVFGKRS